METFLQFLEQVLNTLWLPFSWIPPFFTQFSWNPEIAMGEVITSLSIFATLVVFVIRSRQANKREKRQLTFHLISRIFEPGPVADARITMARWVAQQRQIDDDFFDDPQSDTVVLTIIDFYEYTCEGVYRGVVDGQLLNQESGGRMERAYKLVKKYIESREKRLSIVSGAPTNLYFHLKKFLRDYRHVDIASPSLDTAQMRTEKYFAFGSNMSREQLEDRLGPVGFIGIGSVQDYQLVFNRLGTRRAGGVASIVPKQAHTTHGVIWEIVANDLKKLDEIEDPSAYQRETIYVTTSDSIVHACHTYIAIPDGEHAPSPSYLETIVSGAVENRLPNDYVDTLRDIPTTT